MQIRNMKFNKNGTIDCEIEHPQFGWIPFTADPNDVEQHGRDIHAAALLALTQPEGRIEPYSAPELAVNHTKADHNG